MSKEFHLGTLAPMRPISVFWAQGDFQILEFPAIEGLGGSYGPREVCLGVGLPGEVVAPPSGSLPQTGSCSRQAPFCFSRRLLPVTPGTEESSPLSELSHKLPGKLACHGLSSALPRGCLCVRVATTAPGPTQASSATLMRADGCQQLLPPRILDAGILVPECACPRADHLSK